VNLQEHIKIHTDDDTLYKCDICDKEFTENSDLQKHIETHTDDKPYIIILAGT
jgi:uncharacterized Zn-finger protein